MEGDYAAFCLDEAIVYFGEALEAEMRKVAEAAKTEKASEGAQHLVLERWLKIGEFSDKPDAPAMPKFRNPVATNRR